MNRMTGTPAAAERLRHIPPQMAEALREAALDQDPDRLYELIDGVAEHDAEVAAYLRALLQDFAYGRLEELFGS